MKTIIALVGATAVCVSSCLADVRIIGPQTGGVRPFHDGLGLIESLGGMESITCCAARIRRKDRLFEVDFTRALADTEKDWPLHDGDIVYIPEHVFPCMGALDSARFVELFKEYTKILSGEIKRPLDWQARLDKLPTHTKRK